MQFADPSRPDRFDIRDLSSGRVSRAIRFLREYGPGEVLALVRKHGLAESARFIGRNIRHMVAARAAHRFDRKNGVDTAGSMQLQFLTVAGPNRSLGTEAVSTSPKSFAWMMRDLPKDRENYTFIDVGAGKGLTLMLAADHGFRRIVGVEFAQELAEIAKRNVGIYSAGRATTEIVCADASTYRFPGGPLVVYFYNPFGVELLAATLRNLTDRPNKTGADCYVVYASSSNNTMAWATPLIAGSGFSKVESQPMPVFWDAVRQIEFSVFKHTSRA